MSKTRTSKLYYLSFNLLLFIATSLSLQALHIGGGFLLLFSFIISGLVKELDLHKYDNANKYLNSHETYILVQKEMLQDNLSVDSGSPIDSKSFQYTPLLEQYENLFPNFKLHVDHIETPKVKKRGGKSPSPAGRFTSKTKKGTESTTSRKTGGKRK
jgi:hypothetical protein